MSVVVGGITLVIRYYPLSVTCLLAAAIVKRQQQRDEELLRLGRNLPSLIKYSNIQSIG